LAGFLIALFENMINIKVLGSGCAKCQTTYQLIAQVASEHGIAIHLEKIEEMAAIMAYGVMSTPSVVIDDKIAHSGSIPDRKTILSWLQ
jgi:small redox-active disulfide protein 2